MTPLSPTRRDAEAFASAVDGTRAEGAERFSDLVDFVEVLRASEPPTPRPDFSADLRMRLMDAADTLLLPAGAELAPVIPLHASPAARRQRRISIAAAAFVVIGGTAGVAAAAESALPGDALYPLKRGIETAQVSLNSSDSGRGQDLLRRASTRLDEVDALIGNHEDTALINQTLASYRDSAASGADLIFVEYQRNGDAEELTRLRAMLGSQLAKLDSMNGESPAGAQTAFEKARALLNGLDQQASVLCGNCGPGGISDRFTPASSAPSLASLLIAPAAEAQRAADQAERNNDLAQRADEIAKNTAKPEDTVDAGPSTPDTDPSTGLPLPTDAPDLGNPLSGLTSGVAALLKEVGGEPLAPLTDTLDTLTGGLLK
ncbi:MAG: DUF5667 domain-containing protein [Propionibacteriales bacterium]|nr:DUF5667 domain-containing protein [Propionibacteriales bacterium]